nr:zinc finger, CCHC-type [Tanacetum cinerariifolium]
NGHINVEHVSVELQRADILTKALPRLNGGFRRLTTVRHPKGLRHHSSTPQGAAVVVYRRPTATTMVEARRGCGDRSVTRHDGGSGWKSDRCCGGLGGDGGVVVTRIGRWGAFLSSSEKLAENFFGGGEWPTGGGGGWPAAGEG